MDETRFDGKDTVKPDVVLEQINPVLGDPYKFMTDSFYGTNGYRNGLFLFQYPREDWIKDRRINAYYRNYVRPITRALVDPIFMEEALRGILDSNSEPLPEPNLFSTFLNDVDNSSTTMQEFSEDVMVNARLHGITFVVMDNFPAEVQPATEQEAIDSRILPYIYNVTADKVFSFDVNDFGKLMRIVFREDTVINRAGNKEERFIQWDNTSSQKFKLVEDKLVAITSPIPHGLDVIPVTTVVFAKKNSPTDLLVDPPMFDLARINLTIFNKDSEVRSLERSQSFSMFYLQSEDTKDLVLGANRAIVIPLSSTIPPGFVSPDAAVLTGLVDNNEKIVQSLFQIAEQNGVKGVQSAKSGVAIQWDFFAHENQLKRTSRVATTYEQAIAQLFRLYTHTEFIYLVQYPKDFLPGDISAEIENIKKVLELNVPREFNNVLMIKLARMIMVDEDPKKLQVVVDEINAQVLPGDIQTDIQTDET